MRPAFSQIAQQLKNFLREVKVINGCIQKVSSLPFAVLKIISALFFLLPFIHLYFPSPFHESLCHFVSPSDKPFIVNCSYPPIHSYTQSSFPVYLYDLIFRPFLLLLVPKSILDQIQFLYVVSIIIQIFLGLIYSNDLIQRTYTNITEVNDGEA